MSAERPLARNLAIIGSGILALGLVAAISATPAVGFTLDEIRELSRRPSARR